jgi:hypothetical protein
MLLKEPLLSGLAYNNVSEIHRQFTLIVFIVAEIDYTKLSSQTLITFLEK